MSAAGGVRAAGFAVLARACACAGVWVCVVVTPARADVFGGVSLASVGVPEGSSVQQQADYAHDPTISADGRYVAFDGSVAGVAGVWRRDLGDGRLQAVTTCATPVEPEPTACDAQLPSISADGRFVSFTTGAALDPALDLNHAPDVYVRDMDVPAAQAGAFTLASAIDGSAQGLTYEPATPGGPEEPAYGSVAAGRTALSADGRRVAFVTTAISDLVGPGTPALQVAVRDLNASTTQLVSVAVDPASGLPRLDPHTGAPEPVSASEGPVTYGAVYAPSAPPVRFAAVEPYKLTPRVGASISADGTTVAWMAQNVGSQTRILPDEPLAPIYAEPLWRRIADGPLAPIRRVTGGSEPDNPACIASAETLLLQPPSAADPCQGPFRVESPHLGTFYEAQSQSIPQLSADGYTVAFLADAPPLAQGGAFGSSLENRRSDVYVASMLPGLTRVQALGTLTELAGAEESDRATNATVVDLGISPDGTQVAFSTERTVFPLGTPAYVSAPAGVPGLAELFDADLADATLTRVTQGFAGGAGEHPHRVVSAEIDPYEGLSDGALSPSFTADGGSLAFSSTASNLVYGDGNTPPLGGSGRLDGADAYVVQRVRFPSLRTDQQISPAPAAPSPSPAWQLDVTAASRADGSVVLYVQAPCAGRLSAAAVAELASGAPRASRSRHAARVRVRARRARTGRARSVRVRVLTRTVARGHTTTAAAGSAAVRLVLGPARRALAVRPHGLEASVTVVFSAAGRPTLRERVAVSFRRPPPARARRPK